MTSATKGFSRWLKGAGWFNITAAAPLMIPVLSEDYLHMLSWINDLLGLGGLPYQSTIHPIHALLINTAGADLVLVGLLVLYAAQAPLQRRWVVIWNGIFRTLFIGVVGYYVCWENALPLFLAFALADLVIVIGFGYFLTQVKSTPIKSPS